MLYKTLDPLKFLFHHGYKFCRVEVYVHHKTV
ncbi:unnamed protein product [Leptidea sinapis]|uniref:Uncharacterized protein n=1 Tax=Leptidea sinapis TaxID=189913 RepID=A0A5E4PWN1_9NEOP|nr:unnamed protein product [Leptidea sinapis]